MKKLLLIYFSERNCYVGAHFGPIQQSKEENKILYLQIFPAPKIKTE